MSWPMPDRIRLALTAVHSDRVRCRIVVPGWVHHHGIVRPGQALQQNLSVQHIGIARVQSSCPAPDPCLSIAVAQVTILEGNVERSAGRAADRKAHGAAIGVNRLPRPDEWGGGLGVTREGEVVEICGYRIIFHPKILGSSQTDSVHFESARQLMFSDLHPMCTITAIESSDPIPLEL